MAEHGQKRSRARFRCEEASSSIEITKQQKLERSDSVISLSEITCDEDFERAVAEVMSRWDTEKDNLPVGREFPLKDDVTSTAKNVRDALSHEDFYSQKDRGGLTYKACGNKKLRATIEKLFFQCHTREDLLAEYGNLFRWDEHWVRDTPPTPSQNEFSIWSKDCESKASPEGPYRIHRAVLYLKDRTEKWLEWLFLARQSDSEEVGLFAARRFEKGEVIGPYVGTIIWEGHQKANMKVPAENAPMFMRPLLRPVCRKSRSGNVCMVSPVLIWKESTLTEKEGGLKRIPQRKAVRDDMLLMGFRFMQRQRSKQNQKAKAFPTCNVDFDPNGLVVASTVIEKYTELVCKM